jgi:hypothetical protein
MAAPSGTGRSTGRHPSGGGRSIISAEKTAKGKRTVSQTSRGAKIPFLG